MPRRAATRLPQIQSLESRRLLTAFTVNTLSDTTDAGDNLITLREAVAKVNALPGADAITFAPGLTGSIKLADGQIGITDALTIAGPGAPLLTLDGNNASRIFTIAAGTQATLANLTLANGRAGEQQNGGAISNDGTLTLAGVSITGNRAGDGGSPATFGASGGLGGGVYNAGTLTIRDSAILDNTAGRGADGNDDFGFGGSGGRGGDGGGVYNDVGATVTILNTTLARNKAGDGGDGGDVVFSSGTGGRGGNGGSGGGVANAGTATLVNVTLTSNASGNGGLGGFGGSGGTFGRPGFYGNGGGLFNDDGTFEVGNTLSAANDPGAPSPDAAGDFTSLGHNLIAITDESTGWIASDQTAASFDPPIDAKLGDVNYHGGPTRTVSLLAGSPAIDAGDSALAATYQLTADQRGYVRKYGAGVDVGALEADAALAGDANHDDLVNFDDLLLLAKNYNKVNATWSQGDFSGDGLVNFDDLLILAKNYNRTLLSPPPEVATAPATAPASPVVAATLVQAPAGSATTDKTRRPTPAPVFGAQKIAKPAPPAKGPH
jgi:hypothetical protein